MVHDLCLNIIIGSKMAKITKHKKDEIGGIMLSASSILLIGMLGAAGRTHGWPYYLGGLIVAWFWGEAIYVRQKGNFNDVNSARITFLISGAMILFAVWFVGMILADPEQFLKNFVS
jgi:hypothetical protein